MVATSTGPAPRCTRPPFPSGWNSIPMGLTNLSLENTLPVGQSFLWHRHSLLDASSSPSSSSSPLAIPDLKNEITEEYSRALHSPPRVVLLRQSPSQLYWTAIHPDPVAAADDARIGTTEAWLRDYFHFDQHPSLEKLYTEWRERDPLLFGRTEVDGRARGVRVLRQDPWECLIAYVSPLPPSTPRAELRLGTNARFITSTNNHIPRIGSLMHRLSQHFSLPLLSLPHPADPSEDPITYHLFPPPHTIPLLNLEPTLRELGFGYRAAFIASTLYTLQEDFGVEPGKIEEGLISYRTTPVEEVREKLVGLKGVGRKVADCVMLMSMDQPSLIPIDTHLSAIAARHPQFPSKWKNKPMSKVLYEEVQAWLLEKWGPMGGWAQAVMFAADLPPTTTAKTPAALRREPKAEVKANYVKEELGVKESPASSVSGKSTILITPLAESVVDVGVKDEPESPLKGRVFSRPNIQRAKSSGKRKSLHPESEVPVDDAKAENGEMDLPAAYGFKRTRSASRIQLKRSESGVSAVAGELGSLDV